MAFRSERRNASLLDACPGALRVHRIDGFRPGEANDGGFTTGERDRSSWPVCLALAGGMVRIERDGRVAFEAARGCRLPPGRQAAGGSFTFTLWTAAGESPVFTAAVEGHGALATARRGWDPDWNADGTEGLESGRAGHAAPGRKIFFVAPDGDDDAAGTTPGAPLRTVQAALDRADPAGGDTVLLRGGLHAGRVTFDRFENATAETVVSRHGSERPVVSGARTLTGWRRADASQAALLGPGYDRIHMLTLPAGTVAPEGLEGLGLREGDMPLVLATEQGPVSDPFLFGAIEEFHHAARFEIRGDRIVMIEDPAVLGRYSPVQLKDVVGVVWNRGNRLGRFTVGAVRADRGNALVPAEAPDAYISPDPKYWRYALRNVAARLFPGSWAFRREADGAVTLFVRPVDEASLAGGIAYADQRAGWDIGLGDRIRIQGIAFEDFGGEGIKEGIALGTIAGAGRTRLSRALSVHNCRFLRCHNPTAHYGALYFRNVEGLSITDCTIGVAENSGALLAIVTDLTVSGCAIERLSYAALRVYDSHRVIVAFTDIRDVARVAHANTATFYGTKKGRGIDRLLIYGLRVSGSNGYLTWQGASRVDMGFCDISPPVLREDLRSVVDQNTPRAAATVAPGEPCLLWNNLLRHDPSDPAAKSGALLLGKSDVDVRYALFNNVIGGGAVSEPYVSKAPRTPSPEIVRRSNAYLHLTWWQGDRSGWRPAETEAVFPRPAGVYSPGNFHLPPDSPLSRLPAYPMQDLMTNLLSERYPGFDFGVDIDGHPFDWAQARIGPFQQNWNDQIR